MSNYSNEEIARLVEPTRYHRRLFVDENLFELELERIFAKVWIYVGHESQVKNPGDFITTRIGKHPLVMVRDGDGGEINVLYNRCGHKGATVVNEESGQLARFRCNYHGWIYRLDGKLIGTPHKVGYESCGFDADDPCYSMRKVARCDNYRGFVFANLSSEGPDLPTYLDGIKSSFDNMVDRSPEGRLEVADRGFRVIQNSNWKTFVDNFNDMLHPMVTHQSAGDCCEDYLATLEGEPDPSFANIVEILNPFVSSYERFDEMGITTCANGHGWSGGKVSLHSEYSEIPDYWKSMVDAYGEERAREILSINRHNTIVYPNTMIKGPIQMLRTIRPLTVDKSIIESYSFRPVGAPEALLRRNVNYSSLVNSPASMIGSDDAEVYERTQQGLYTDGNEWIDMHRFYGADKEVKPGVKTAPGTSDLSYRNMYQAWKEHMTRDA